MPTTTGPVGGSQLDVQSLVAQLVAAERGPAQQRIQSREVQLSTKISAVGQIKGALSAFKSALEALKSSDAYNARKVTVSDTNIYTATATTSATAGSYNIEVTHLASAHQLRSNPYVGGSSSVVGTGTLTITVGTTSFAVTIGASNNTLSGIAAAINSATNNAGVEATFLNGTGGTHLVFTSKTTGASTGITVAQSGGDGGLAAIASASLTQIQPAQNARVLIGGVEATSTTNVFADAIQGVTLTAKAKPATAGTTVALTVERDVAAAKDQVKKFIAGYNALQTIVAKQRAYDPASRAGGPLVGDAMVRGIEEQLRRDLTTAVSGLLGDYTTLASIGIKTNTSGQLTLDDTKLAKAIDSDATILSKMFAGANGVATRIFTTLENKLGGSAEIESRVTSLTNSLKQVDKEKQMLDTRMAAVQSRYLKQFTALDSLLSQLSTTSAYLGQQLAQLPGLNGR